MKQITRIFLEGESQTLSLLNIDRNNCINQSSGIKGSKNLLNSNI